MSEFPPADIFAGMSRTKCADVCTAVRCVVTESASCGHPRKSGLQAHFQRDPALVARYEQADDYLRGPPTIRVA
jgi:hypothetical protein